MVINFRAVAQDATTLSKIMAGKEKMLLDDLIVAYPEGVTVIAVDIVPNGDGETYSIFNFKEDAKVFVSAGVVFKNIVNEMFKYYTKVDGTVDVDMLNHDLSEQGGVLIKFYKEKNSSGNITTYCKVL